MTLASDGLRRILDCSRDMENCAREGQWERLLEIETERAGLIEGWFASPGHGAVPGAAECLAAILESNRTVLRLSESHRDHLIGLLRGSKLQCHAVQAYRAGAGQT